MLQKPVFIVRIFVCCCLIAAIIPLVDSDSKDSNSARGKKDLFPGWPTQFAGESIEKLELSAKEQGFLKNFPGRIGRFTDGSREIVYRWITHSSRRVHPSADCLKAIGYTITPLPIEQDVSGNHWGCSEAQRRDRTLKVCERIHDLKGNSWSDVSSWYWAGLLGQTKGPWWAITVAN